MNKFEALMKYFPSGVADGERVILERVFVRDNDFAELLTPPAGNPRLIIGSKGSGKSALLDVAELLLSGANVPVISLAPSDLELPAGSNDSIGDVSRAFVKAVVSAINAKLSSSLPPFVEGKDQVVLAKAIEAGEKQPDLISKLSRLVAHVDYKGIRFNPSAIVSLGSYSLGVQLDAIKANIQQSNGAFFVLLDDIDQLSRLGGGLDIERIYAALIGIKKLAADIPQLRLIVTLREEVWRALGRSRSEKLDQLDHFSMCVRVLSPSKEQIKQIVRKRLHAAAQDVQWPGSYNEYEPFFQGSLGRMPTTAIQSSWDDLIVSRSRERPRDAVQLVGMLGRRHLLTPDAFIDDADLEATMPEFSRTRVELLAQEYAAVCPQLANLIESLRYVEFDAGAFKATAGQVREFFNGVTGRFSISFNGVAQTSNNVDHVFNLWRLLFDVGVLNPRIVDVRKSDDYRHVSPREEPDFVSLSNWSEMQKATWEVNPAYRDRLATLIREDEARLGFTKPSQLARGRSSKRKGRR